MCIRDRHYLVPLELLLNALVVASCLFWLDDVARLPEQIVASLRPPAAPDPYLECFAYSRCVTLYKPKSGHARPKREGFVTYPSFLVVFADNSFSAMLLWSFCKVLGLGKHIALVVGLNAVDSALWFGVILPLEGVQLFVDVFKDWLFLVSRKLFDCCVEVRDALWLVPSAVWFLLQPLEIELIPVAPPQRRRRSLRDLFWDVLIDRLIKAHASPCLLYTSPSPRD